MDQTSPKRFRLPRTISCVVRRALYCVVVLTGATFVPVWTGLSDRALWQTPDFNQPRIEFRVKTRTGPDGLPHVVTSTNFWRSDALQDIVVWFDILNHFD